MITRLDRYIANNSALSRSEARALIRAGMVQIAGQPILNPASKVGDGIPVVCAGRPVLPKKQRYLMLNKPAGYVCAARDGGHRTVMELIGRAEGLHLAGRLDIDTTGLVLLTDDGDWSHAITSPRRQCLKVYLVGLAEAVSPKGIESLRQGVQLIGEQRPTMPALIDMLDERRVRISISEGKYHQVKRMFAVIGNRVVSLHREQIGAIHLDPALRQGDYRPLRPDEISSVKGY